jgi:hypothetical protein
MQQHQTQREYKSQRKMRHGIAHMARHGWRVVATTEVQQRSGCLRILAIGIFAAIFKPKPHYLVTFAK